MMAGAPLRNINDMVLALLLLLAGVGPGGTGSGPGGAVGQLAAKPTRGPHPSSPCPSVFSYEGREPDKNRWYGVVLVATDETLDGLRLGVRLTHPANILGNFIGDVTTSDNTEFTILSLKQRLSPGPPLPVRIFVTFGDRDEIPYIGSIKLNGRTICGSSSADLGHETLSRPQTVPVTASPRDPKPSVSRPAGVGGAGGGVGGAGFGGSGGSGGSAGIAASHQFEEEARPRPSPPPPATRAASPPPRPAPTPVPAPATSPANRPSPVYEQQTANANPNYYPGGNAMGRREPPAYNSPVRPAVEDVNYTNTERGIYQPPTPRPTPAPAHQAPRTTLQPRTTAPPRTSGGDSADGDRGDVVRADSSRPAPQPWPTSNYDDPASAPAPASPSRSRPSRATCGTIAPPATPLIINGETSIPGKWPWHVALYKPHGKDWKYQCGGSLVSPTVVVTAAHCVTTAVGRPLGPESLLVFLGKHALRTTSEDGVQDKHVYFIHVHPEYNYTNYRNDIAVLILASPATITSAVRPVCLWDRQRADLSHVEGKFGTVVGWRTDLALPESDSEKVVGWGIETDGLLTEELHQALMPVVPPAICVYSYPSFFGVYTNNKTYCAGYSPDQPAAGTSVCNGDSGGGMFFKRDEDVPDDEAVWMMRGLVSLSVRTKQDRCDPSHFVVFTDVAKYVDWLENFLVP